MTDFFTEENIGAVISIVVGVGVLVPVVGLKLKELLLILNQIAEFIRKDSRPNQELYEQAKKHGLDALAQHINKKVEPDIDFSKVEGRSNES